MSATDGLGPLPVGAVYTRALGSVGAAMYTYTADQVRTIRAEAVAAERNRCAALCLRPPGWLTPEQQALANEIRNAILSNAGTAAFAHNAETPLYTANEVRAILAAARERCAAFVQSQADECKPGSEVQMRLASVAACLRD